MLDESTAIAQFSFNQNFYFIMGKRNCPFPSSSIGSFHVICEVYCHRGGTMDGRQSNWLYPNDPSFFCELADRVEEIIGKHTTL